MIRDYEISVYQCGGGHRQHRAHRGEKCRELQAQGHECVLAYGRAENGCEGIRTHRIGTDRDIKLHGLMTRTLDLNGFCSTKATKEFVQWIR